MSLALVYINYTQLLVFEIFTENKIENQLYVSTSFISFFIILADFSMTTQMKLRLDLNPPMKMHQKSLQNNNKTLPSETNLLGPAVNYPQRIHQQNNNKLSQSKKFGS